MTIIPCGVTIVAVLDIFAHVQQQTTPLVLQGPTAISANTLTQYRLQAQCLCFKLQTRSIIYYGPGAMYKYVSSITTGCIVQTHSYEYMYTSTRSDGLNYIVSVGNISWPLPLR